MAWTREQMAARAAKGVARRLLRQSRHRHPDAGSNYIPDGIDVSLQSENGMLGMGPFPMRARKDADLINAGKQTVSELPTPAISPAPIFGMVRGGISTCRSSARCRWRRTATSPTG
jgi:Acyl CoA:acetate/3-ketoacid CoA transferase, beta subunit